MNINCFPYVIGKGGASTRPISFLFSACRKLIVRVIKFLLRALHKNYEKMDNKEFPDDLSLGKDSPRWL